MTRVPARPRPPQALQASRPGSHPGQGPLRPCTSRSGSLPGQQAPSGPYKPHDPGPCQASRPPQALHLTIRVPARPADPLRPCKPHNPGLSQARRPPQAPASLTTWVPSRPRPPQLPPKPSPPVPGPPHRMAGVSSGALPAEGRLRLRPGLLWSRGPWLRAALRGAPAPGALGAGAWGPDAVQGLSSWLADEAGRLGGVGPGAASKAICTEEMAQGCQP